MTMEGDIKQANEKASKMESSLVESKHELLKVQEMLEMAEQELEKKVRKHSWLSCLGKALDE